LLAPPFFICTEGGYCLNKQELLDAVAGKNGITKKNTGNTIDALWDVITDALAKSEKVCIIGFGTF